MRKIRSLYVTLLLSAATAVIFKTPCLSVEIQLDGAGVISSSQTESGRNGSGGIAYLDIEQIFNEHPMTLRLKGEFEAEVDKRKKELSDIENSMKYIQGVITSTTTEINGLKAEAEQIKKAISDSQRQPQTILLPGTTLPFVLQPVVSTGTVKADPAQLEADEKGIKDREAGLELLKAEYAKKARDIDVKNKTNKEDLVRLEATNTQQVLSDIYKVLQQIAIEDSLTIVVDKNNVLYGQSSQDITGIVRERMRGR